MKLNAIITSERGKPVSKTGNDFLEIELSAFRKIVGHITIDILTDQTDELNQYIIKWFPDGINDEDEDYGDPVILREGHLKEGDIQVLREE